MTAAAARMTEDATRPVERTLRRLCRVLAVLASVLALSACYGFIPIKKSRVEAQLPEMVSPIVVGQTDRTAVRAALGEPWVSSEYWEFDLFRRSDKNVDVGVVLLYWWPIPIGVFTETVSAYVLVAYDEHGGVVAYDKGSADSSGASHLWLQAGEIRFSIDGPSNPPELLVTPKRRDEWTAGRQSSEQVTVIFGCPRLCGTHLVVDDGKAMPLPSFVRTAPPNGQLVLTPLSLAPGDHRISNSFGAFFMSHVTSTAELQGAAGDLWYAVMDVAEIQLKREAPEYFMDLSLLIWRDGAWLALPEPR